MSWAALLVVTVYPGEELSDEGDHVVAVCGLLRIFMDREATESGQLIGSFAT